MFFVIVTAILCPSIRGNLTSDFEIREARRNARQRTRTQGPRRLVLRSDQPPVLENAVAQAPSPKLATTSAGGSSLKGLLHRKG